MKTPVIHDPVQQPAVLDACQQLRMLGRLDDIVVARLVLSFMSENPRMKERHPGAFLTASETVKRSQIRYARAFGYGKAFAQVARGMGFVAKATFRLLRLTVRTTATIARQRSEKVPTPVAPTRIVVRRCQVRRRDAVASRNRC